MDNRLLYKFFIGEAKRSEEIRIRKWYEKSEVNREIFYKEREIFDAIILSGHLDELSQAISAFGKRLRYRRLFGDFGKVAAAAVVTLALALGVNQLAKTGDSDHAMQTITVPAGQRINITLPDGTDVWVNSGSSISYNLNFNDKQRHVLLDGEAFFDVVHNPSKPFVVQTEMYDITVLGTKFNVNAFSGSERFETGLVEGSVKVASLGGGKEEAVTLRPNEQASLSGNTLIISNFDAANTFRWKDGLLIFDDDDFENIISELQKFYGATIEIRGHFWHTNTFTGKFRDTDGIEHALRVLQMSMPFNYKRDVDTEVIIVEPKYQ